MRLHSREANPFPDFVTLAEHVSPAVVNIRTSRAIQRSAGRPPMPREFEEFFGNPFGSPRGPQREFIIMRIRLCKPYFECNFRSKPRKILKYTKYWSKSGLALKHWSRDPLSEPTGRGQLLRLFERRSCFEGSPFHNSHTRVNH